jgi:hypothetical protein
MKHDDNIMMMIDETSYTKKAQIQNHNPLLEYYACCHHLMML